MKKAGVALAPGFEESETLYIVDVLRRCGIVCELTGWSEWVEGAHGVVVKADRLFDENDFSDTILILPGGYDAVDFMLENEALCAHLKERNRRGQWIGAPPRRYWTYAVFWKAENSPRIKDTRKRFGRRALWMTSSWRTGI